MPGEPDTPVAFSRDEAHGIREALKAGARPVCPLCGGALTVTGPLARDGAEGSAWQVRCRPCRPAMFIPVPGTPSDEGA
jgi:hypothetical protein